MTAGVWINRDTGSAQVGIMGAWNDQSNDASWLIWVDASNKVGFNTSNTGSYDATMEVVSTDDLPTGRWVWLCLRLDFGTELKGYLYDGDNKYEYTLTTAIDLAAFSSNNFHVGRFVDNAGTSYYFDGKVSQRFFSQRAMPDEEINYYYEVSRNIFGV
jgi:hypothetical protein